MKNRRIAGVALATASALCSLSASAADAPLAATHGPIRVILVGDSTMAPHNGYGDALCERFKPDVKCINLALNGRSSKSFRAEGHWDEVERLLKDGAGYRATYVLVQFGHNDQPGKRSATDLASEFPANMARYATEVQALGGVPVLVTPLTRRTFKGAYLHDDLAPWSQATRAAAARAHAAVLDLNTDSAAAVQAMGQQEADTLAVEPPPATIADASLDPSKIETTKPGKSKFDRTHLGPKGAALFARIVETELVHAVPDIRAEFRDGGKP